MYKYGFDSFYWSSGLIYIYLPLADLGGSNYNNADTVTYCYLRLVCTPKRFQSDVVSNSKSRLFISYIFFKIIFPIRQIAL